MICAKIPIAARSPMATQTLSGAGSGIAPSPFHDGNGDARVSSTDVMSNWVSDEFILSILAAIPSPISERFYTAAQSSGGPRPY